MSGIVRQMIYQKKMKGYYRTLLKRKVNLLELESQEDGVNYKINLNNLRENQEGGVNSLKMKDRANNLHNLEILQHGVNFTPRQKVGVNFLGPKITPK